MSTGGGSRSAGALVARAFVLSSIALLLLPALLPAAPAQSSGDPWWGPSDRTQPTTGWAVRIPVVVENPYSYPLFDHLAAVDIDIGAALVKAGWTNQTSGGGSHPRGFRLDVDSIRVVEYGRGFASGPIQGSATEPTPHRFYASPFEAERYKPFDPTTNPSGTVMFPLKGLLQPGEKRFFYVYANPLEYGKTPPAKFKTEDTAALDAYLWGSTGTVHYGYEPQQTGQSHLLRFRALSPGTTNVQVFQYSFGKFAPVPSTATNMNPLQLAPGSAGASFFVPAGAAFKVVADKPIMVAGHGTTDGNGHSPERFGFVPSTSGSFAGTSFSVFGFGASGQRLEGQVAVTTTTSALTTVFLNGNPVATLTRANPTAFPNIPGGQWSQITTSGGKVLVSMATATASATGPIHAVQVPALTGGPTGYSFATPFTNDGGFARICPKGETTLRIFQNDQPSIQIYPEGNRETAPPAFLEASDACTDVAIPPGAQSSPLYAVQAGDEVRHPIEGGAAPFSLIVGAGERQVPANKRGFVGHYGGEGGVDYFTKGRTGIFGHYNDTRITIIEERLRSGALSYVERTIAISRDGFIQLDPTTTPDATGRYHLVATKPIGVVSLDPATYKDALGQDQSHSYARYVPGRPEPVRAIVGGAEYRGPLVELRSSAKDGRTDVLSTGPGNPVGYRLDVLNLGRWIGGESLPDTIAVTCTAPAGWTVEGCAREVTLASGAAERLNLVITPSVDDVNMLLPVVVEARSKSGNVSATFKLNVLVEIRYGVGMWFDVEGGRKTIDPAIGVNPGDAYTYNVLVKNTGSTTDTFRITVEDPRPGWTQQITRDGEPVTTLTLEGEETATLAFRVQAPDAETAPQNLVSIKAQSQSSALAGDIVNTATRIRPKININMALDPATRLAEPNQTAEFNISVVNAGNDIFRIAFNQDSVLPTGWNATLSVPEIDLSPNAGSPFVLKLLVTPPPGARAGDLATVKISAETDAGGGGGSIPGDEISAVVVVRKVHNVTVPALFDAVADPGETLRYVLPIQNLGNGNDAIEILPGAVTPSWKLTTDAESVVLAYNESGELPLRIEVPQGTKQGLYNLTFTLRLSREAFQNLTLPVEVRPLARVTFDGPASLHTSPGRAQLLSMTAVNTGNLEGNFTLSALAPEAWNVTFSPERVRLAPGASTPVVVALNASREAPDADYDVDLVARLDGAEAGRTPLPVSLARPLLFLSDVAGSGTVRAGELVLVSATVGNRGDIAAENVSVALVVDGAIVDRVVLNRIPINEEKVATLNWVATSRSKDVHVVLDPEEEIVQATRDDTVSTVAFGGRILPTPAPAPVLLLLTAAGAALLARRRLRS